MFSEYDNSREDKKNEKREEKEKKRDENVKEKVEEKGKEIKNEENDESERNHQEKGNDEKVKILKSEISSKMTEYRSFFDSFPNAFHEDTSGLSMREGLYESFASEVGGVTEKKINGFDRKLGDGKTAEVREEGGEIYLKITQEGKDGNAKELSISLNNFESIKDDKKDESNHIQPTIGINGDESLLIDLLGKDILINDIPEGGLTMKNNPDLFKKVFDSVNGKIINPEKEELYGYVDRAKKIIDSEQFSEFLLQQDNWANPEWGLDSNSFVEYLITGIEQGKMGENALNAQDLIACKVLLSLCILLRNSNNNIQTIKKSLGFIEDENIGNIGKEKTMQGGENLIEFLPINETDLKKFMACRDKVIQLGSQEVESEKIRLLSSGIISNPYYNQRGGEIARLLHCLNK